ncbi:MAG: sialate O-acetylesterase [Chitinophagaceae bacterium]
MKNYSVALLLVIFYLFNSLFAEAEVRLPSIIGNHMVLQQKTEVKIWGWCDPGEKIKIRTDWDTTSYATSGSSGAKWSVQLKTPAAGGPYKITIAGANTIILEDVLIGEVWVCSGQSNMEMNINWGLNYPEDVTNATNKSIRFFHIPRVTSDYPQEDIKAKWVVCNRDDMKRFSAVGYFFGSKLQQEMNIPVGLINSSWGGTPAETWTPREEVEKDSTLITAAKQLTAAPGWPIIPGIAYNAMIYPLTNYKIAGAIWYQGESNVPTWSTYHPLLNNMIGAWRKAFQKEFPFYFVQIAPFSGYGKDNYRSALLREAQTKVLTTANTGMVVVSDLVDNIADIHPKLKKEVGVRLANYALAETYGKTELAYKSPVYKTMKVEKNKIRISFDYADKGLLSKGGDVTEFYIAGANQNFLPASAKIEDNTVVVFNKDIKDPVAVRFGFNNSAMPNLYSKEGLPVNSFRTDNWPASGSTVKK